MTDRDTQHVLTYYFPDRAMVRHIQSLGGAGGWSGSQLWRVTTDARTLCLRRFPEGSWQPRLAFIHDVLSRVSAGG